jgi:hypothetical protein
VVAQRFESFPERERPQKWLALEASLRRKVAMKNKRERERCTKKEEEAVTGSDMSHEKEEVAAPGSSVVHGRRRLW